jgi:drug/metabolite transporter (DMT)-like permease
MAAGTAERDGAGEARRTTRAWALLACATLFWSGNFVVGRALNAELPPVGLAFWRWIVAALVLLPFAGPGLWRRRGLLAQHWRRLLVLSVLGVATFNTLVYIALHTTTAINGALVYATTPAIIAALTFSLFGERVRPLAILGVALSFIGVAIIILKGELARLLGLAFTPGDLLVLLATLSYASYTVLLPRWPTGLPPFAFLLAIFILGALELLPFYVWEMAAGSFMPTSLDALLAVLYVALCASILSYVSWNEGTRLIGARRAGLASNLVPIFTSTLGVLLLGEHFAWFHGVGVALIFAGIWLATRRPKEAA